jgi:trk system potassium uptake protein
LRDFLLLSDDFAVAAMQVPAAIVGKTLAELKLRAEKGITIIGYKRRGEPFRYAEADTVLTEIIVSGHATAVRRFSDQLPV